MNIGNIGVEKWVIYVNKIIIKHFIKFLKANNALDSYLVNLNKKENACKYCNLFKRDAPSNIILYFGASKLISYAFDWSKTMEGRDYWNNLDNMWYHIWDNIWKRLVFYEKQI